LQTIVTTIIAAVYGGLLTLVGVAWTIQRQNQEKKNEEIKKFRPVLSVYNDSLDKVDYLLQCNNFKESKTIKFNQNEKNKYAYLINDFSLLNIDYASLFIQGLIINQAYLFYRNTNLYIDKNRIIKFSFNNQKIYTPKKIQTMGILLKDLLGNEYVLGLGLDFDKTVKGYIKINVFDTKKMIPFDRRGGNSK
jgi:hypothetical protein